MTRRLLFAALALLLVIGLLAACGLPPKTGSPAVEQQNSQATQAALSLLTELARPTRTPTLMATRTPTLPTFSATSTRTPTLPATPYTPTPPTQRVTPLPGLMLYTHADLPNYVFQIDPNLWAQDSNSATANLIHQTLDECQIQSVPGRGIAPPDQLFWQDLGRFRWEILDYSSWAYALPVLKAGGDPVTADFLFLGGYSRKACRTAQEKVLANLMLWREADGEESFVPFQSPTPRPALAGFECPNTPSARLRVGDEVSIITNGLWLRSEPRVDSSTKVRQFLRYAPVTVQITGGPVCETYVYWQVQVTEVGEGGQSLQGWMAEGDSEQYYLLPVK